MNMFLGTLDSKTVWYCSDNPLILEVRLDRTVVNNSAVYDCTSKVYQYHTCCSSERSTNRRKSRALQFVMVITGQHLCENWVKNMIHHSTYNYRSRTDYHQGNKITHTAVSYMSHFKLAHSNRLTFRKNTTQVWQLGFNLEVVLMRQLT